MKKIITRCALLSILALCSSGLMAMPSDKSSSGPVSPVSSLSDSTELREAKAAWVALAQEQKRIAKNGRKRGKGANPGFTGSPKHPGPKQADPLDRRVIVDWNIN